MTEPINFEDIAVGDKVTCIKPQGDFDLKYEFIVSRRTRDNLFAKNGTGFDNVGNYKWELIDKMGYPFDEEPVLGWLTTEVSGIEDTQLAFVSVDGYQKINGTWMDNVTAVKKFVPAVAVPEDLYLELADANWGNLQQARSLRDRITLAVRTS